MCKYFANYFCVFDKKVSPIRREVVMAGYSHYYI